MSKLTLYTNALCPYAQRAWLTLEEKGLEYEAVHIPLRGEKPAWYWEVNPRGTVPTLKHGDRTIHESLLIAEYLDDAFPDSGTRLLPSDPYKRYASRFVVDQFSSQVAPAFFQLLKNQDRSQDDKLKEEAAKKLKALAELFAADGDKEGPFFLGAEPSFVDIAIAPFLHRLSIALGHYRDFDVLAVDERFKKLHDALVARDSWKASDIAADKVIDAMAAYANPTQ